MGLRVKAAPGETAHAGEDLQETDEEIEAFEARIYGALLAAASSSSQSVRNALGACVLLRTPYARAPEIVRDAIRDFIDAAEI